MWNALKKKFKAVALCVKYKVPPGMVFSRNLRNSDIQKQIFDYLSIPFLAPFFIQGQL